MFTGFASENTPAIQVWDFFSPFASTSAIRSVSLADDCAPIQYFKTGATTTAIALYLPSSALEGKQIKIINSRFGSNNQLVYIYSSDSNFAFGSGSALIIYSLGQGQTLDFCYSKNFLSFGPAGGNCTSGWICLNQSPTVATNSYAVAFGENNHATGKTSAVVGGTGNIASGTNATAIGGSSNTASGQNSIVAGSSGSQSTNSGSAVLGGTNHLSNGSNSSVICGQLGTARLIAANLVLSANIPVAGNVGVSQAANLILARETTGATATTLTSNSSSANTANQVILPNNSAYTFQGTCIAARTAAGDTSSWKFEGAIKRGANAASTALVAAVTPLVIAQDVGAATWVLAITADTTNGGIKVEVTGAAATTIRWVVKIETTEVTF
jgi:hypothetical protein